MAIERKLTVPNGYDSVTNPRMASFAAQLDAQMTLLKETIAGLEVHNLEWQPHTGVNTIGMLLAHLAIVDLWWIRMAPRHMPEAECETMSKEIIGIGMDDDGLPIPADGKHPAPLAGKSLVDYNMMLDKARLVAHDELRAWRDSELDKTYNHRDRIISYEWTVYHVLEHFCGHRGQIQLLLHLQRDAGVLARVEKK